MVVQRSLVREKEWERNGQMGSETLKVLSSGNRKTRNAEGTSRIGFIQYQIPFNLSSISSSLFSPTHVLTTPTLQDHLRPVYDSHLKMPRSKNDSKPRGRMTAYAFFVQTCREEHKRKHPDESVVFAEFSRKCADRWKTMVEKEKKRFQEMADRDKKRYESEMLEYVPPKGEKGRGKKRRQTKDPNAPKRSLSAFFWFCNDERGKIKQENPEFGVGDIAKELGKLWSETDPEAKKKYEALAQRDKERYEKEMNAYKKKAKMESAPPQDDDDEGDDDDDEGDDE